MHKSLRNFVSVEDFSVFTLYMECHLKRVIFTSTNTSHTLASNLISKMYLEYFISLGYHVSIFEMIEMISLASSALIFYVLGSLVSFTYFSYFELHFHFA